MITLQQLTILVFILLMIIWPIALGIYFQNKFRLTNQAKTQPTTKQTFQPKPQQSQPAQHNPAQTAPDQLAA